MSDRVYKLEKIVNEYKDGF